MNNTLKEQILKMKEEDMFLITYYAKKYREIITRKGKFDNKCRDWTTPKGSYCFCYFDMDAETVNPYRTATNPIKNREDSMNEKNTDHLLKLIDDLIKLVGKNVDNINRLGEEIADLKAKK